MSLKLNCPSHHDLLLNAVACCAVLCTMSRARLFFRTPPFKSPSTTFTAHRHANRSQLELPLQSRLRWSYLWYGSILAIGVATGLGARQFAAPLGLPAPGSPEDRIILQSLS